MCHHGRGRTIRVDGGLRRDAVTFLADEDFVEKFTVVLLDVLVFVEFLGIDFELLSEIFNFID